MVMAMATDMVLKLHSPAGAEPNIYKWPLTSGRGSVSFIICYVLLFQCVPLLLPICNDKYNLFVLFACE